MSRVGGKAQLPAYRAVAGDLRLAYSQFEELERFSRYGTRIDEETRKSLEHGRRIREVFKQRQYEPLNVTQQITLLFAANAGLFDSVSESVVGDAEERLLKALDGELSEVTQHIEQGEQLTDKDKTALKQFAEETLSEFDESSNSESDSGASRS